MENLVIKGNSKVPGKRKRNSKGKMERNSNLHKAYATTLNDSDSSNSDSEESCDGERNYSAFMTIAHVKSLEELNLLV